MLITPRASFSKRVSAEYLGCAYIRQYLLTTYYLLLSTHSCKVYVRSILTRGT